MKKVFLLVSFLSLMLFVEGQILKKITDKAKQKIENKTDKPAEETTNKKKDENKVIEAKDTATTPVTNNNQSASLKVYSKYDFVPGERILVFEDFMQDAVGDFPAKWNTNATGEIMTIDKIPGHWFAMGKTGVYMPDFIDALPDDFTLEFDMLIDQTAHSWGIDINLVELPNRDQPKEWQSANNHFSLNILPGTPGTGSSSYHRRKNGVGETTTRAKITQFENISIPVHISFWRQKERLRVYMNEEKVWDVPKAIQAGAKLNSLVLSIPNIAQWHFLITNLRLAVGAPDTRKKYSNKTNG